MALLDQIGSISGGGETPDDPTPDDPTPDDPTPEEPDTIAIVMDLIERFGGGNLGFAAMNILGLSDGKFPTGHYILIQTDVAGFELHRADAVLS